MNVSTFTPITEYLANKLTEELVTLKDLQAGRSYRNHYESYDNIYGDEAMLKCYVFQDGDRVGWYSQTGWFTKNDESNNFSDFEDLTITFVTAVGGLADSEQLDRFVLQRGIAVIDVEKHAVWLPVTKLPLSQYTKIAQTVRTTNTVRPGKWTFYSFSQAIYFESDLAVYAEILSKLAQYPSVECSKDTMAATIAELLPELSEEQKAVLIGTARQLGIIFKETLLASSNTD